MGWRISAILLLLLAANQACGAEIWRCRDGSFTSTPRKDQSCELVGGSTRCIKGGYRAISAKSGTNQSCSRISPQERAKLERELLHSPGMNFQIAAAKPRTSELSQYGEDLPAARRRGGAQVSEETYQRISGTNPFSGPEGLERLRRVAGERDF